MTFDCRDSLPLNHAFKTSATNIAPVYKTNIFFKRKQCSVLASNKLGGGGGKLVSVTIKICGTGAEGNAPNSSDTSLPPHKTYMCLLLII